MCTSKTVKKESYLRQRQASIKTDEELYQACKECLARKVCRVKAIVRVDRGEVPSIELSHYFDSRLCIRASAFGAMSTQKASVPV